MLSFRQSLRVDLKEAETRPVGTRAEQGLGREERDGARAALERQLLTPDTQGDGDKSWGKMTVYFQRTKRGL